ncbi:MAG: hypothetical protein Q8P17_01360 [bacterium]|nr:hypothetical protein [bacterium]
MRTFFLAFIIFLATLSVPFSVSAISCQTGYIERDDGSGCDLVQTSTSGGNITAPTQTSGGNPAGQDVKLINPLKGGGNLMSFLQSILDFVIKIGTVVVILMMVFVGYKFVVAQGAPDKIKEARDALLWTLIGALILLGSKAIAFGIEKTVQAISVGG